MTIKTDTTPAYEYRLSPCPGGSDKYGNCEVCKKPADSVYLQAQMKIYQHEGRIGKTSKRALFGHKECLIAIRK